MIILSPKAKVADGLSLAQTSTDKPVATIKTQETTTKEQKPTVVKGEPQTGKQQPREIVSKHPVVGPP